MIPFARNDDSMRKTNIRTKAKYAVYGKYLCM